MNKNLVKNKKRKRVLKLPATLKKLSTREQQLSAARELSERITRRTIAAGISERDLKRKAYSAFLHVKTCRRSDRN